MSTDTHKETAEPEKRNLAAVMALLAFAHLIISIDYTIVFVALPEIGGSLGFSAQSQQWIISAFVVPYGGLLMLGGRASDLLGRRRMFILGLLLFAVASLAGGLAGNSAILIAARAVQGIGGAFLFPATLSLINTLFHEGPQRNRAIAIWAGVGGSGMALGALLGGVLTETWGWRAVFFVVVPLSLIGIVLALMLIHPDRHSAQARHFDLPGATTATAAITLLVFGLVQGPEAGWSSAVILASLAAAAILLAIFVAVEYRSRDPLLPLHLLRNRNLTTGIATILLYTITFGSLLYFLTIHFQVVLQYSALQTGLAYLVPYAGIFAGSSIGGTLASRLGVRVALIGSLVVGLGGTLMYSAVLSSHSTFPALLPALVILSLGMGATFTIMFAAVATDVLQREQGIASGLASTAQQIGYALGLAMLVPIANAPVGDLTGDLRLAATADGLRSVILLICVGIVLMIAVALNFRHHRARRESRAVGQ